MYRDTYTPAASVPPSSAPTPTLTTQSAVQAEAEEGPEFAPQLAPPTGCVVVGVVEMGGGETTIST